MASRPCLDSWDLAATCVRTLDRWLDLSLCFGTGKLPPFLVQALMLLSQPFLQHVLPWSVLPSLSSTQPVLSSLSSTQPVHSQSVLHPACTLPACLPPSLHSPACPPPSLCSLRLCSSVVSGALGLCSSSYAFIPVCAPYNMCSPNLCCPSLCFPACALSTGSAPCSLVLSSSSRSSHLCPPSLCIPQWVHLSLCSPFHLNPCSLEEPR